MWKTRFEALKGTLLALTLLGAGGMAVAQDDLAVDAPAVETAPALDPALESAAPVPVVSEPVTEEVENPYGLKAAWNQGDIVSKGAFVILGIMSAATWYVLIVKLIEQAKILKQARSLGSFFETSPESSVDGLKEGTAFWHVATRGLKSAKHHDGSTLSKSQDVDRATWIQVGVTRAGDDIQSALQGGLAVLATVGSTAPFVGLFGTVWGIYHALTAIGVSGQASIDKVAGPVGEALIMTALGLAVAVPAVLGYNWLVRRNKTAMEAVRSFGNDLHAVLLSGSRVG